MRPWLWLAAVVLIALIWRASSPAAPPPPVPASAATATQPTQTEPAYRGNTNTRKFHKRGCR